MPHQAALFLPPGEISGLVEALLKAGARPTSRYLVRAVGLRRQAVVEMLLAAGADPNEPYDAGFTRTPLQAAISTLHFADSGDTLNKSVEIVEMLLAAGANRKERCGNSARKKFNRTALQEARFLSRPSLIQALKQWSGARYSSGGAVRCNLCSSSGICSSRQRGTAGRSRGDKQCRGRPTRRARHLGRLTS